jgi:hypothetical protein
MSFYFQLVSEIVGPHQQQAPSCFIHSENKWLAVGSFNISAPQRDQFSLFEALISSYPPVF